MELAVPSHQPLPQQWHNHEDHTHLALDGPEHSAAGGALLAQVVGLQVLVPGNEQGPVESVQPLAV
jgi:hypothetical protein